MAIQAGDTIVDGTFGAGGYSRAFLAAGAGQVIGFDRDPDAIAEATSRLPDERLTMVNARFSQMDRALAERGIGLVDSIALDIGVSSMQIDRAERGFSFQADGPLDMRMEKSGLTAADYLNSADEADIARVLREFGEEPRARAIARAIVAARPVERTAELAAIVRRAAGFRPGQKSDPATRTFQAIRIHLNAELDELEQGLEAAERALKPGGRLAVVTFHSLEDRIVKRFLRTRSGGDRAGRAIARRSPTRWSRPSSAWPSPCPRPKPSLRATRVPARRASRSAVRTSAPPPARRPFNERPQLQILRHGRKLRRRCTVLLSRVLRVASERAALEDVETRIVLAQRDLRVLQTEIGTRGRLAQLERWNASVLALSAPTHDQFLQGGFELARLARPDQKVDFEAPVVLAAAPKPDAPKVGEVEQSEDEAPSPKPSSLLRQASLKTETREVPAKAVSPPMEPDPGQGRGKVERQAGYGGEAGKDRVA